MAGFVVRPMTAGDAQAIAAWRYPEPYSFYDWDQDPDDLAELLDPSEWGRRYFAADDCEGLAGFFVFKLAGGVAEIGLGLRADLTGRGLGCPFLQAGMDFAATELGVESYALAVAAFNERAIAVYRRAGFREVRRYDHATNGGVHEFVRMVSAGTAARGRRDAERTGGREDRADDGAQGPARADRAGGRGRRQEDNKLEHSTQCRGQRG